MATTGSASTPTGRVVNINASRDDGFVNGQNPARGNAGKAERWKEMTPEAIAGAQKLCPAERWEALKEEARESGTVPEGVEAEATRRWRADRTVKGQPLGDEMHNAA